MHNQTTKSVSGLSPLDCDARCFAYVQAFAYTVRQPCLVLDSELVVRVANEAFCQVFQIPMRLAEGRHFSHLGNGEWNIPALRTLLEEVLSTRSFLMGFEISHEFPFLGQKHLMVNAHAPHIAQDTAPLIFLSVEDMTGIMSVAETITSQIREIGAAHRSRTNELEAHLEYLEKELQKKHSEKEGKDEL